METKFQTSFIPKKPLPTVGVSGVGFGTGTPNRQPRRANSLFLNISIFLFIVSLAAAGGSYTWKNINLSSQESLKKQLSDRKKQFNPSLIEELKRVNVKIDAAKQLLSNHLSLSNVFDIIGRLTIDKVRFLSMDMNAPGSQAGDIKISMKGSGMNLSAVAFQSQVLGRLEQYGLRKIVKNPIISNPALDAGSAVTFEFSATIEPSSLSYAGIATSTEQTP